MAGTITLAGFRTISAVRPARIARVGDEIQLNLPPRTDECTGVRILSESVPPPSTRPSRARRRPRARWAVAAAGAAVLVALAGQPAAATVTLTPSEGYQGDAAELTFSVSEDRAPHYTSSIEIVMPDAHPVAEVYPLSAGDWAPRIAYRDLATGLPGIHGQVSNSVVTGITWLRAGVPATAVTLTTVNDLKISLGPLPQTDNLRFLVVQTYSDGVVKRWTTPVMTLKARPGQQAQPSAGAGGGHAGTGHDPGLAAGAPAAPAEGGNLGIVVGVIVALVVGIAIGGAVVASSRMRPGREDGPADAADSSPAEGSDDDERSLNPGR
jgi:hypothetical protein